MASPQFISSIRKEESLSLVIFVLTFPPTSTISLIRKSYSMINILSSNCKCDVGPSSRIKKITFSTSTNTTISTLLQFQKRTTMPSWYSLFSIPSFLCSRVTSRMLKNNQWEITLSSFTNFWMRWWITDILKQHRSSC